MKRVLRIGTEGKSKLSCKEKYLTGDIQSKIDSEITELLVKFIKG